MSATALLVATRSDGKLREIRPMFAAAGLTLVLSPLPRPRAEDSPILLAMQDEMKRSMADLRMKGEPAPYFIDTGSFPATVLGSVLRRWCPMAG